jgi:uncharacterized protein YfaS (alpha-2-macroglobulin family)
MKPRVLGLLTLVLIASMAAGAQSHAVSFNLSTSKSFAPGEPPSIHLYTHNVDALEFRIYRVNDPVKFIENLRELHSFGPEASLLGPEQIDERTRLERFHDWKLHLWHNLRSFFRDQFSDEAQTSIRNHQSSISRRSRIVSEAEFAQIPILNQSQLVARWRQLVPPTYISDSNNLPVPKLSAGLYLLEATDGHYKAYTLLMVTQMALVTRTTSGSVIAYVVDRSTGQPIPGAKVDTGFGQKLIATATSDTDGVAQLTLPVEKSEQDNFWVVAGKGNEFAAATPGSYSLSYSSSGKYAGYVYTERPVYRPTHTVHWKAILREHNGNSLAIPKAATVQVTISDENDKSVFDRPMPISATGDIHGDFELPKDASLGYYSILVGAVGAEHDDSISGGFHVEDYRKPEYRVQVSSANKRLLEGDTMPVTIDSRYFFGEPVANANVKYRVYNERHYWWGEEADDDSSSSDDTDSADAADAADTADSNATDPSVGDNEEAEQTGKLDADGKLVIQVPTHVDATGQSHPDLDYTVEAGVTDAANREITGRGRFLATYSTFRINVEPISYAVHTGESAKFRITAVDYDDKPVSTHVHVQLAFHHYENGSTQTTLGAAVDVATDATGHATGELPVGTPKYSSAELEATASAVQPGTRDPMDDSFLWIMGAGEAGWSDSTQTTQIVADKKSYAPGDIAHLSILSETDGFYALVVAQGYTVQKREVMHTDGKTIAFDLPITSDSQPNITVDALFLKDNTLYQATKVLKVPPVQQQLQVQITPAKDVFQPQQTATYDVVTKDFAGKPVSADLSFGVVDEAIYSLYPDSSGDMVKELYPQRYVSSQIDSSLDYYFAGEAGTKSPLLALRNARYRPQLAQVKPGNEQKPRVRKAFPDTAFWAPNLHTDASGHARVSLTFPDSLTTWRATVRAITADSKAGSSISRVLVRKNILVRMGTPRFMLKGDEITLPVIVHNYLDTPKQATISLKVQGLDVVSGAQQTVTIPSKGEATTQWRLKATQVGTATLDATAITDAESDALELTFPVNPAGVAKTLAQSGVITQNASQATTTIDFPTNTDPSAHSLRIEVAPSIAGSLFSALDYLTTYPYGCTEQTMSSYLPNVIVAETLSRLKVPGHVDNADLLAKMQAGLDRLKDYQHDDGGWGWWKEDSSRVYMTAYVVGGLGQGEQFVPLTSDQRTMKNNGMDYLRKALAEHPKMRPELRAAVVYALAEAGDTNLTDALNAQWTRRKDLQPEALAMTGLAMLQVHDSRASQAATLLASEAQHQGELVSWKSSYAPLLDSEYSNDAEATAYAVRLLAKVDPNNALLAPAAQWLMLARNGGVWWDSTEQTAMVLFGLVDYLAASHELDADFTADILVNGKSVGQRHFTAADALSGASLAIDIDAAHLQPGANSVQLIRRSGSGRMYWSARGRFYSTQKSDFQAGTMSLNLTRDYYKLQPVQKDGKITYALQPLSGTAQVGDVLAVHEAINGSPMRYLLLEDPIPAGTEFVQSEDSYPLAQRPGGWYDWFTRREFHDDHAAFFSDDFSGRQEIFYLIRVVNPGTFQISPARVEPMYQHGVQATSDALQLIVPAAATQGGPQ